ncbi:MAG: polysaccharide deacetylase family protein [Trueperaceae bacterium]|nr:polysaccharide deacetylase family protein [Trueperaceae bacterium]
MNRFPILMYHSVAENASEMFQPWCIRPEQFEDHLVFLQQAGYQSLTLSQYLQELNKGKPLPEKSIVLTFDDGFLDFYTTALPLLQRYGFTATLYIATAYVGQSSKWLEFEGESQRPLVNWAQIREIHEAGIEIGAHTHTHPELDLLSNHQVLAELKTSKHLLEDALGVETKSLAYPHGYFSQRIRALAIEAGYDNACAVKHAMSKAQDDRFALSRVDIRHHVTNEILSSYLSEDLLPLAPQTESIKTKLWRLARRYHLHRNKTFLSALSAAGYL